MIAFSRRFILGAMAVAIALLALLVWGVIAITDADTNREKDEFRAAVERARQPTQAPALTQQDPAPTQQATVPVLSSPGKVRVLKAGNGGKEPASTVTTEPPAQAPKSAATTTSEKSVQTSPPPPAASSPQTVNGLGRRGAGWFAAGEAVIGYEIVIDGLKYRTCYFSSAPGSGTVTDGVINPWSGEVVYSECGQGVADPDTVNGMARRGPGPFNAGDAVTGFFTMDGKDYQNCSFNPAPSGGTVTDGVINPWSGEIAGACTVQTGNDTVNGMARRGPGPFNAGEAVTGFFEIGGKTYGNCYLASAPSGGTVTDGVINPWPSEAASPCSPIESSSGSSDTVNGQARRGPGPFTAGEAVTGFFEMDGKQYNNCYMASAPKDGTVTDGVINPWPGEVAATCSG